MLLQYLTLNWASFRDIAFLLYPAIALDRFPWDSTCEVSGSRAGL